MKKAGIILSIIMLVLFGSVYHGNAQMMGGGMMGQGMMKGEETGKKAWLGVFIQNLTPELAKSFGLKDAEGVLITDVAKGSPAESAGLKRQDVIKEIGGHEVKTVKDILDFIGNSSPNDEVSVKVLREGKPSTFKVALGTLPASEAGGMGEGMGEHGMMGGGMMGQGMMSPQDMGSMMGGMMGQMMQGMMKGMMQGMRGMMGGMGMEEDICPAFKGGMMGRGGSGMGGMRGHGMSGMGHHRGFLTPAIIDRLNLNEKQIEKIRKLEREYKKESIRLHSDIKIAYIDLKGLLSEDDIDMREVKAKAREIGDKKTELLIFRAESFKKLKGILTDKQRKELRSLGCF